MLYLLDKSCPSDFPCNGNGHCDFLTGTCICNIGNAGLDCSGQWNLFLKTIYHIIHPKMFIFQNGFVLEIVVMLDFVILQLESVLVTWEDMDLIVQVIFHQLLR